MRKRLVTESNRLKKFKKMHSLLLEDWIRWHMMSMAGSAPKIHLYMIPKTIKEERLSQERILKYNKKGSLKSSTIIPPLFQEYNQVPLLKNMRLKAFNNRF